MVIQICNPENVQILKGVVCKDHVHLHIEYPPSISVSNLVKKFKGRTSRLLQQEFPSLGKQYWGRHFWAVGYRAWSTGNIIDEMVQEYLERHRDKPDAHTGNWLLDRQKKSFFTAFTTYGFPIHSGFVLYVNFGNQKATNKLVIK